MPLDPFEIVNGTFSLIFVVISVVIGITMILTYFKSNDKLLLLVGITWIGIVSPWYPSTISFLVALINDVGISRELYFLLGNVAAPVFIFIWLFAFTEFFYRKKRKIILLFGVVYGIIFEVIFLYLLIFDPSSIGTYTPPIDVDYEGIYMILALSIIIILLTTGIKFSYESIKARRKDLQLKGKFLLIAFISYGIGAILDAVVHQSLVLLIITRIILILAAVEWYFGFILPDWLKEKLIK
ncbi:MAG: hypothetical protein GF317_24415 [Candidatus Lokiarchaeota archaeon]|nr:hypothetical protein [Candidatus Lokiarchaeota archaeon]MBD3202518.1 hypothetical protein [Candidatus Lokiarchaeota archaeon]